MILAETFDTHIKAISTAEEWGKYKAMTKQPTLAELDKRYIQERLKTEWERPRIVTQNNKAMKYRVKTSCLKNLDYNEIIKSKDGGNYIGEDNEAVYSKDVIERNPDWFEPVEQVQEGDYFKRSGAIYRVMGDSIYEEWNWKVLKVGGDRDMPNEDDYKTHQIEHRKLSTYEIEQVLIKECHNRYKKGQRIETVCGHEKDVSFQDLKYLKEGDSLVAYSGLQQGYITFYQQGNWAEIVDQTPHIEINGYEAELKDDVIKVGCSTIHKDDFKVFSNFVYDYELAVQKCGEDITDQIKTIAEYYDQQQ